MLIHSTAARDARCLGKSILKKDFLIGPEALSAVEIYQPPDTGLHYRVGIPIILQFPPEILCKIFTYIEPIWLFQLEEAYRYFMKLLSSSYCNKIWYDMIPPALMSEPECFQDEMEVARCLEAYHKSGGQDRVILPDLLQYQMRYDQSHLISAKLNTDQ